MRVLLDTQILFWWYAEAGKLSKFAREIIEATDNSILVSAVVAWELSIKVAIGKLNALPLIVELSRHLEEEGFEELPISLAAASRAGFLPLHHRDPFDRLLVAQAQELNIPLISTDPMFDHYGVRRLW